ncbi:MAG: multidrug effflux MFS transporter [Hyphomicrobiaceae bacterium]|nr:multidrug effflux MFS transporter [Hyphomicrobiaceae bacterium]MCC0024832.1 multidrug effflux MFS transporter [Hyphomicrobiaceae bacterium]
MTDRLAEYGRSRPEFIGLVAALMALNALAIDVMLPALPYMGEALNVVNENDRQLVLSVYMLGFGTTQLLYGPVSDALGRRKPLFFGLAIYLIAAFSALIAPNFGTLLALRFVQGLGAASTRVIAQSVVRDTFHGRAMAEIMSLVFMVFMIIPVIAPAVGQVLLLTGPWSTIFLFMGVLASAIALWAWFRLPETLRPENRRKLELAVIVDGFRQVVTNRVALFYAIAGIAVFGSLFGFINASQQIYVEIYGLGPWFPAAFATMAGFMAIASFINSRVVQRFGQRRISHTSMLAYLAIATTLWLISLGGTPNFWLFLALVCGLQFFFGWMASNMNSLALEPLGHVAGTASAVFGFMQTVGGAILGGLIGHAFNGTVTPIAFGFMCMGVVVVASVLIAERGKLFGSHEDQPA